MKHEIIYLPIGKLKPNPDNPRLIRDANFKRLVKSLKDCPQLFDARPCICSDRTGDLIVLGGNMRLMAAKELKYSEVPVIVMSGLTPDQEREIVVKDNGENFGEWDFDLLANWSDEPLKDWGVDLPEDWLNPVEGIDPPELKDGDRAPFQQMTFTLHDEQAEELNAAIKKAKNEGGGQSAVNENSNGNALAFIAERFNRG
jgi:hypothetical protein